MSIHDFKIRLKLITGFVDKMGKETIPCSIQRVMIKIYAGSLNIRLTDKMIEDIILT